MKRLLNNLLCAITCTAMIASSLPVAAIADELQAQEGTTAAATAQTQTPTQAEEDPSDQPADAATAGQADQPGTTDVADANSATEQEAVAALPSPLNAATDGIAAVTAGAYAHSATASQNGVTFTVAWNDATAGTASTFHVTQSGGSAQAKARMDAPTYWDTDGQQESVCDPGRNQWSGAASYKTIGADGYDFTFELTASGRYNILLYFMDTENGITYLRTTDVWVTVDDPARPSVTQIVNGAVAQCKQETDGSEYAMALWLHDWALDQLEYDHSLNWCSAESGLTRHQGTCESYQRIFAKLLNAAGIANGRITGNGHTWNAAKIDGKWCQMDLTWDDTSDNWYGDLDQRHLYFGLTDELMAIAHSDHTKNYQEDGYVYRSTDLSNNYFVRNGKADEWAGAYTDRIQQHLDAREESFSIDADNQSFPPSISGIQNEIVAYAMDMREWSTVDGSVSLAATSSVATVSSHEWKARFNVMAKYPEITVTSGRTVEDGAYFARLAPRRSLSLSATASGCALTSRASAVRLAYDEAAGGYSVAFASGGVLTLAGGSLSAAPDEGSASQRWLVTRDGEEFRISSCADGSAVDCRGARYADGNEVWAYAPNGGRAQAWVLESAD